MCNVLKQKATDPFGLIIQDLSMNKIWTVNEYGHSY